MDRYKRLFSNSLLFGIGNLGSKLISLVMVPLYTYKLTTSEYGFIDLITVTVSLLVPIITLELGQATIRFVIDRKDKDETGVIFFNSFIYSIILSIIILIMFPALSYLNIFGEYLFSFLFILVLAQSNSILSNYVRGIGLIKQFAFNGILQTVVLVICNILFLVVFNLGVDGYLISIIISSMVSNTFLFLVSQGYKYIFKGSLKSTQVLKSMVTFSIPLIPNSTMWWVINGATRYFILFFVGSAGNGLYAVASKIPSIISVVNTIFIQSWQISAFEEYESKDKDEYNSFVYTVYYKLLFMMGSGILMVIIPTLELIVSDSFSKSWILVPFLVLGVIYQSLSGFLGVNYTASHKTKGAFLTSVYGGIASVISNMIFIPLFGLFGASLSASVSFFIMWYLRLKDTQEYVKLSIKWNDFILVNAIFLLQTASLYLLDGYLQIFVPITLFIVLILSNFSFLKRAANTLIHKNK